MHIGHITTDYLPITGGAEAYVNDLINILQPAEQMIYQLDTGIVAKHRYGICLKEYAGALSMFGCMDSFLCDTLRN